MWRAQIPTLGIILEIIISCFLNFFSFFRSIQVIFFWNYFWSFHWFLSAFGLYFCLHGLIFIFAFAQCPAQIFVYKSIGKNMREPIIPKRNFYNTFISFLRCAWSHLSFGDPFFLVKIVQNRVCKGIVFCKACPR